MNVSNKFFSLTACLFFAAPILAQEPFVYPAKGQSQEQLEKDKFECYQWARQNTGVDPVSGTPQAQSSGGSTAGRRAAGGAVKGLAIANIAGGSGSKGAAAGAVVGGARGAAQDNRQRQAQQQQAAQTQQSYNRAYSACLEGRGYTVK